MTITSPSASFDFQNDSSVSDRKRLSSHSFSLVNESDYDSKGINYGRSFADSYQESSHSSLNRHTSPNSTLLSATNRNTSPSSRSRSNSHSTKAIFRSRSKIAQENLDNYPNFHADYDHDDDNQSPAIGTNRQIAYDDLTAIDWQYEYARERLRVDKVDHTSGIYGKILRFIDTSHIWIVILLTGMSVAMVSAFIDIVSRWLADVKFGYCVDAFYLPKDFCCSGIDPNDKCNAWITWEQSFEIDNHQVGSYAIAYVFYVFFAIIFAAAGSILVMFYAPHSRLSGIPEIKTILSGFIIRESLGFKTLMFKAIGLILVVSAGLWIGKEGPLVHVACCCAAVAMQLFPQLDQNEAIKREVLAAASSAGISVAFGSPIGGVLFSLEQLTYYFPERTLWTSFVAAMVGAVTLQFINPFRSGNLVLFQVIYDRLWHRFELVPFAFIGILGGLYGALFNTLNIKIANWRRKNTWISNRPLLEVIIVTFITGIVTYPIVYARIPATLSLSHLFQECSEKVPGQLCSEKNYFSTYLVLTFTGIQGFFLTAYTYGINIPAGIIMPSMLNGALIGRAIGILMNIWQVRHPNFFLFEACPPDQPCITPGVYALVGAASTLCGVTHLTVSTVVIMFELTGALNYVLPIMTGVMVSKWVSDSCNRKGIYESWIRYMEYPYLDNHVDESIPDVSVESIMTTVEDLTTIPANYVTIKSLKDLLDTTQSRGFPIVRSETDMTLIGYITAAELRNAVDSIPFRVKENSYCTFLSQQQLSKTTVGSHKRGRSFVPYTDDVDEVQFPDSVSHEYNNAYNPDELDDFISDTLPISLRKYAELTPMTLSWDASLQLAASMFQKLGLRFILFTCRGQLKGMLTRKDVWQMINSIDTDYDNLGLLSESSKFVRGRLLNSISHSLRGSEDEADLLMSDED